MKKLLLLSISLLTSVAVSAYDIAVENADGVTIYYNYINDGTELEVTQNSDDSGLNLYSGSVNIPEEVTYEGVTRKVTSIGSRAFLDCPNMTSIEIPNSVTRIKDWAFSRCQGLTSLEIPNSVTTIEELAFVDCFNLASVTIPNSITSIGNAAFFNCNALKKVIVDDIAAWCNISFEDTSSNPVVFSHRLFSDENTEITSIEIPNTVTSVGNYTFSCCHGITSVTIPNSVTSIGERAFEQCTGLTSIEIPSSVTSIGKYAFVRCQNLAFVVSKMENPCTIDDYCFSGKIFLNTTLYVPQGTIDLYKSTDGWNNFNNIVEGNAPDNNGGSTLPEQCATPTISYANGKLTFDCATEGATCKYTITDSDIQSGIGSSIDLTATYQISVYAVASDYRDSETATATLCWIEAAPQTEGLTDGIAQVRSRAIMLQSAGGIISLSGVESGQKILVYGINGQKQASATATSETTSIPTTLRAGEVAIVKVGEKSVKLIMK